MKRKEKVEDGNSVRSPDVDKSSGLTPRRAAMFTFPAFAFIQLSIAFRPRKTEAETHESATRHEEEMHDGES